MKEYTYSRTSILCQPIGCGYMEARVDKYLSIRKLINFYAHCPYISSKL